MTHVLIIVHNASVARFLRLALRPLRGDWNFVVVSIDEPDRDTERALRGRRIDTVLRQDAARMTIDLESLLAMCRVDRPRQRPDAST